MSVSSLNQFITVEDGAVTVDWVVLTAALVGLGLAVMSVVSGGVEDLSENIASGLATTDVSGDDLFDNNTEVVLPTPDP